VSDSSVTNSEGSFSFPGLQIGSYTVTVTLDGFKTFIANNVVLTAGAGANVKATLEVGGVTEQVVVSSASEIVQTQSSTVSSTINTNQISKLPLTSRSAMDFIPFLPGVSTPGGNRDSTINGLPKGVINITLDGVNIQDNTLRTTDGFFAIVAPRLDAIEEVTVTSAANGADSGGQGAVNIRFVTKSGTNNFKGNMFFTLRHDALNANTFFNNRNLPADPDTGKAPKSQLRQYQPGFNVGGPITIPGLRYLPRAAPAADAGTAKLMQATAADDSPFLTRLGADGSARVTVTFANLSGGPAPDPGVVLTVSRGGKQVGRYPLAWTGGPLPVGARRTLTADLSLPGGWFRDYEIGVALGRAGHQATVRTLSAAVRPWGELVAPATLAVGVVCLLAARRRRHEPVRGLRVRRGAVAGPRSGAGVPGAFPGPFSGPFSAVEAATLGIVAAAPELENATAETAETSGNGSENGSENGNGGS